ncbi:Cofilin/tropomyosin-type actin-binding protein, partial [Opisthorchis viverrini]
ASGVKCHQSCIDAYNELKLRKNHRYILFHIRNNEEIQVLRKADRNATYEDFYQDLITAMDEGEGRYAVYDYEVPGKLPTLIFISWYVQVTHTDPFGRNPSPLSIKTKLIYAASKDAIRLKLIGIKHEVEANDIDEIAEEELRKKVE